MGLSGFESFQFGVVSETSLEDSANTKFFALPHSSSKILFVWYFLGNGQGLVPVVRVEGHMGSKESSKIGDSLAYWCRRFCSDLTRPLGSRAVIY